jgi:hypothetical protein
MPKSDDSLGYPKFAGPTRARMCLTICSLGTLTGWAHESRD